MVDGAIAHVGPVLSPGRVGQAVAAALQRLNPGVTIEHKGGYLRVLAPGKCVVTRQAVEEELGDEFNFATDLELVMPSFQGRFVLAKEEARWE